MRVQLLGRVAVIHGGRTATVARAQARGVLAVLALDAGRVVSLDRLAEAMWGGAEPTTARAQLHSAISSIRAMLAATGADTAVDGGRFGYSLAVDPTDVDALSFEHLVGRQPIDLEPERRLRAALALWQGEPLADASGSFVDLTRARLVERRLQAVDELAALDLAAGRYADVAADLAALVTEHPDHERLRGRLMLALFHCGRKTAALRLYHDYRRRLAAADGLDPGAALTAVAGAILRDEPPTDPGAPAGPERRDHALPPRTPDFVGRRKELARVDAGLRAAGPAVVAVIGMGGLGKSTLAVEAAHRARDAFPDGCLYADLRGTGPRPADPHLVTATFLRDVGIDPDQIPDDPAERLARYRAYTETHRVLIVLDDARDEDQVRTLLPAGTSAALVTARAALAALDATPVRLAPLSEVDGGRLLSVMASVTGAEATAVARLCGGLPLALRIAGARLAAGADPAGVRENLADEWRRLDELTVDDRDVRGTLALSHRRLGEPAAALFALLGPLPVAEVPAWVPGALRPAAPDETAAALAELTDAALLTVVRTGDEPRYRLHDLVQFYAREQTRPDRDAGLRRVYENLAGLVVDNDAALTRDGFPTPPRDGRWFRAPTAAASPDPAGWFAAEREFVTAAIEDAAARGWTRLAAQLLGAATNLADLRGGPEEVNRLTELLLADIAGRRGLEFEEATLLLAYGGRRRARGGAELDAALPLLRRARRLFHAMDDPARAATSATEMAIAYRRKLRPEVAARFFEWAIARFAVAGHPPQETPAHVGLGNLHLTSGRLALARESYTRALALVRRHDGLTFLPNVLGCLAEVRSLEGDHRAALDGYHEAMARAAELDDRKQWAQLQYQVARVHRRIGDPVPLAQAADRAARALDGVGLVRLADRARTMAAEARAAIDGAVPRSDAGCR